VLRTGEPSCRTRIVGRAARAGALSLPLVRPQFAPSPAFCSLLLSNCISVLGSRLVGHLVLGSVQAVRSRGHSHVLCFPSSRPSFKKTIYSSDTVLRNCLILPPQLLLCTMSLVSFSTITKHASHAFINIVANVANVVNNSKCSMPRRTSYDSALSQLSNFYILFIIRNLLQSTRMIRQQSITSRQNGETSS
jgi:hypothetical protein